MLESVASVIKSKKFPPILLMFGEEEFLLDEAYTLLVAAATDDDSMAAFNFDTFDGSELTPDALVEMASAFPMMAERRVVVVKHFDKMNISRAKDAEKKSPLTRYFANPSPTTFLLLLASVPDLNGLKSAMSNSKQQEKAQKKLKAAKFPYNILLDKCEWMEFPKLYERDMPSWVANRFKSLKREIMPDACELLVAQSGESLRDLHNEIQKIITFVPDKPRITRDDIATLIGASKTYNIFELQKSVGAGKLPEAIEIMRRMLAVDRQELLIITMLTRYFLILWKLTDAVQITRNQYELGKSVEISPFFVPEYMAALQIYSPARIERSFFALREADVAVKSSESADIVLQKMLVKIIGQ